MGICAEIEIPMGLPSWANWRGHTRDKGRAIKAQRMVTRDSMTTAELAGQFVRPPADAPITIELTRVVGQGDRGYDEKDNAPGALKSVRDEVSNWLGHKNDNHARLRWRYPPTARDPQNRPGYSAARVKIIIGHHDCPTCGQPTTKEFSA